MNLGSIKHENLSRLKQKHGLKAARVEHRMIHFLKCRLSTSYIGAEQ